MDSINALMGHLAISTNVDAIKHIAHDIFTARAMLALQALYWLRQFRLSVRPSVRLSVRHTPVLCQNGGT